MGFVIKYVFCVLDFVGRVTERRVVLCYGGRIRNDVFGFLYYLNSTLC